MKQKISEALIELLKLSGQLCMVLFKILIKLLEVVGRIILTVLWWLLLTIKDIIFGYRR